MTPRERWTKVIKREKPDRIPMFYQATQEATDKLLKYLDLVNEDEMLERLHIDKVVHVRPEYVGHPLPKRTTVFCSRYEDFQYNGTVYTGVDGKMVYFPLAGYKSVEEIEKHYQWPDPDWWDYSVLSKQIEGLEDCIIYGGGSEPFLDYREHLRGREQAYIDLIENPEIVHYCMNKLFDFYYENTKRIFEAIPGKVFYCWIAEDLGTQESLLFSPGQIREFFIPGMKRMVSLVHEGGAYAFHHSDGAIRAIIPDIIEAEFDVLNPIQWRCRGMERKALKQDFGDKIIFHGGIDNQYTLAFGTVEEVRREVRDNIRILGNNGGYILGPCHNIQAVSPPGNIVAMYEAGYEYGKF